VWQIVVFGKCDLYANWDFIFTEDSNDDLDIDEEQEEEDEAEQEEEDEAVQLDLDVKYTMTPSPVAGGSDDEEAEEDKRSTSSSPVSSTHSSPMRNTASAASESNTLPAWEEYKASDAAASTTPISSVRAAPVVVSLEPSLTPPEQPRSAATSISTSSSSGGILGAAGSRTKRVKGASRLKGSVEVAIKRREEVVAAATATVASSEDTMEQPSESMTTSAGAVAVEDVVVEEAEVVEDVPKTVNPLVPSSYPFCSVLPPLMHAVLCDPAQQQSGKATKECQTAVIVKFDMSESDGKQGSKTDQGDAIIYLLLAWMADRLEEWEARITAVHLSAEPSTSEEGAPRKALVITVEGLNPHSAMFLSKAVMQAMQTTTLGAMLDTYGPTAQDDVEAFTSSRARSVPLSSMGAVLTADHAAAFLHQVSLPAPATASGKDWMRRLGPNSVVACLLKPYLLQNGKVLAKVFSMCEAAGLRLCGLRTAYVDKSSRAALDKIIHAEVLTPPRGQSADMTVERDGAMCTLVALFYSSRFVASETLRNLLGPDDPALAKRTDPSSIRAVCGTSKFANICFPLSSLLINSWRDVLFWFGPRSTPSSNTTISTVQSIVLPAMRYAVFGISIEPIEFDATNCSNRTANAMATLQRLSIQAMQSVSSNMMHFLTMWSTDREEQTRYGMQVCGEADYVHGPACYLTAVFVTHVGDAHADAIRETLRRRVNEAIQVAKDSFMVNLTFKMREKFRRHERMHHLGNSAHALAMRSFADEDFDSHEDVGLQDVVVCSLTAHNDLHDNSYALCPQELALHILQALPPSCHTSILGISTPNWDSPGKTVVEHDGLSVHFASDKIHICFRGLHLIENISSAIRVAADVANGIATSCGGALMTSADVRMTSVPVPSVTDVRVIKGRRALETVAREFLIDKERFMHGFADMSLQSYVPSWAVAQKKNDHVGAGAAADTDILKSLFCPGSFDAVAVVVVPYPPGDSAGAMSGVFFRVLKKLEKESLDVKYITTSVMTPDMAQFCADDIIRDGEDISCTEETKITQLRNRFNLLVGKPVLAIVVQGNSALRRLVSVVGPVDDVEAAESYPTSIAANIASFLPVDAKSASSHLTAPNIFFSRTCGTAQRYIQDLCGCGATIGAFELSLCPALTVADTREDSDLSSSPGSPQKTAGGDSYSLEREAALRTLRDQCLTAQQKRDATTREICQGGDAAGVVGAVDVTCIVLTAALTTCIGISPILQAVHKEGIKVIIHPVPVLIHLSPAYLRQVLL
jgi:nucleoside diphosphate kinase